MTMRRGSKYLIGTGVVAITAIATVFVGPFTYFETIVPPLSPVLQKPDGVPSDATASYHWKGFGLFWQWEREFSSGCASWGKAADSDFYSVHLTPGEDGCLSSGLGVKHVSHSEKIVIDMKGAWGGGEPCPRQISPRQIESLNGLTRDASVNAMPEIELRSLKRIAYRLERMDGEALTTDYGGGCNDLKPSD